MYARGYIYVSGVLNTVHGQADVWVAKYCAQCSTTPLNATRTSNHRGPGAALSTPDTTSYSV